VSPSFLGGPFKSILLEAIWRRRKGHVLFLTDFLEWIVVFGVSTPILEICFDWVQAAEASVIKRIDFSLHALPCRVSDQGES